jgi:hypothetical protein
VLSQVVDRVVGLLARTPDPVLSAERLAARRPAVASDVPAIAIGVELTRDQPRGIGRELGLDRQGADVRHGDIYSGTLAFEIYAANPGSSAALAGAVERRLSGPAEDVRSQGFLRLEPAGLLPAEQIVQQPAAGSAFAAWRQRLDYRFSCEIEEQPPDSAGGPIRRVDIEMGGDLPDSFAVPG